MAVPVVSCRVNTGARSSLCPVVSCRVMTARSSTAGSAYGERAGLSATFAHDTAWRLNEIM